MTSLENQTLKSSSDGSSGRLKRADNHANGPTFPLFRSAPELSYVITQAVFCIPGFVKASLHQCLDPLLRGWACD